MKLKKNLAQAFLLFAVQSIAATWIGGNGGSEEFPLDIYNASNWNDNKLPNGDEALYFEVANLTFLTNTAGIDTKISTWFVPKVGDFVILGDMHIGEYNFRDGAKSSVTKKGDWKIGGNIQISVAENSSHFFTNKCGNIIQESGGFNVAYGAESKAEIVSYGGDWTLSGEFNVAYDTSSKAEIVSYGGDWTLNKVVRQSYGDNSYSKILKHDGNWTLNNDFHQCFNKESVAEFYNYGGDFSTKVLNVGFAEASSATIYVKEGAFTASGNVKIGCGSESIARFTNDGGVVEFNGVTSVGEANDVTAELYNNDGLMIFGSWANIGNKAEIKCAYFEISGGVVSNKSNYVTLGGDGPGVMTVKGGRYCRFEGGEGYGMIVGNRSKGELNIEGGEVVLGKNLFISLRDYVESNVKISNGGLLDVPCIEYGKFSSNEKYGNAELSIDGGILRARSDHGNFIPSNDKFKVTVGSNGGIIDTANHAITINASLSGEGKIAFKGGNVVTLKSIPAWTGGTEIEVETCVNISSEAKDALLEELSVRIPETAVAEYENPIVSISDGEFDEYDLEKISIPDDCSIKLSEDKKTIVLCTPFCLPYRGAIDPATKPRLVFPRKTLADFSGHTLRGRMQGAFTAKGVELTFFNKTETKENDVLKKITYQAQALDKDWLKAAKVEFYEESAGVFAKLIDGNRSNWGNRNDFGADGEIYIITVNVQTAQGIRLIGTPGGNYKLISCGELEVYAVED